MKLCTYVIGATLRRAWDTTLRVAEAMDASPMEDIADRVDRLEQEMAAMKEKPHDANTDVRLAIDAVRASKARS